MRSNKGITLAVLVITIVVLLIIASISIGTGNKVIKSSELENMITNMLLIKAQGKEYVENANFKLGPNFESATDKEAKISTAKGELKGEEITGSYKIGQETVSSDDSNCIYYYKLSEQQLNEMGISKIKSNDNAGWYVIKYDVKKVEVDVYNTKGFENDKNYYYSLEELQNLDI